jgi:outer membrane protein assembly factor BamB
MVVRTVRTGEPIGYLACDESRNCPPRILEQGRSVRVTAEDAGTGAERWTSTLEFDPTLSDNCQTWPANADPSDVPVTDPDLTMVNVGAESVSVEGCGVSATLSVGGVRLDPTDDAVIGQVWVTELGSGRFAVEGDPGETVVVDAEGEILRTVQGRMSSSPTAPDAPDDLWFVTRRSGVGFAAVREDGSEAWMALEESRVALAARDVVIVNRGNRLVGLDRATGAKMWEWADDDPRGLANFRTLTDGETVAAQLLPQDGEGEGVLVAVDLGTGEELWEVPLVGSVVAVDGHLVEFTSDGVRGLG